MDASTIDKIEPTGRGVVLDVERGQAREMRGKIFDKSSRDRLKETTSFSSRISNPIPDSENSGERTIVLSFRPLQLRRIEALQDEVLTLQVELAATRPTDIPAKEKQIDEALQKYG